jgi:hypothetical protein
MDVFEPLALSPKDAMRALLEAGDRLAGAAASDFNGWLADVVSVSGQFLPVAFFGRAVNGGHEEASDLDVVVFHTNSPAASAYGYVPLHLAPKFVHAHALYENRLIPTIESWEFLLPNALLVYPARAPDPFFRAIMSARQRISSSEFFHGGIGDIITYAAYKARVQEEREYFGPGEWERCARHDLSVDLNFLDTANMLSRRVGMRELDGRVREKMRLMEDADVNALTNAAMRRLRVRESRMPELQGRFIRELRR